MPQKVTGFIIFTDDLTVDCFSKWLQNAIEWHNISLACLYFPRWLAIPSSSSSLAASVFISPNLSIFTTSRPEHAVLQLISSPLHGNFTVSFLQWHLRNFWGPTKAKALNEPPLVCVVEKRRLLVTGRWSCLSVVCGEKRSVVFASRDMCNERLARG